MANEENLKPIHDSQRARELQEKSVEARKRNAEKKRTLRAAFEELLDRTYTGKNGEQITGTVAAATKIFEQAMKGNIRAFEVMRDTVGQAPVQEIKTTIISEDTKKAIEEFLDGADTETSEGSSEA